MKKLLALVMLSTVALAGCAGYKVIDPATAPLANFGKVQMGSFTVTEFMATLKGTDRYDKYLPVSNEANRAVYDGIKERLVNVASGSGAPLVLSGTMQAFSTGSGAARGLAAFGLVPAGVGNGVIEYYFTLSSGGKRVASYTCKREITGGATGAYAALAKAAVSFIADNQ